MPHYLAGKLVNPLLIQLLAVGQCDWSNWQDSFSIKHFLEFPVEHHAVLPNNTSV